MSTYRVRFVVETCIKSDENIVFDSKGHRVVLLLSEKKPSDETAHLQVDVDAANYQEAQLAASGESVPPVLDALAFSTGTPLLLLHWDFVLKKEPGAEIRRAIYCEKTKQSVPVEITENAVLDAQRILSQENGPALPLLWHRYALQRSLILDRFLFQWLAFEGLAGKKQISTFCPRCGTELNHCDKPIAHEGSDRENGYALFSRVASEISRKEFSRDIWGKTRNSVFHGSAQPGPELLSRINSISPKLHEACDLEFTSRYGLKPQARSKWDSGHRYKYTFLEWRTKNPKSDFADDFPWDALSKQAGEMVPGEIRMNMPEASGISFVDFQKEAPRW
jgi:hypothetical protein